MRLVVVAVQALAATLELWVRQWFRGPGGVLVNQWWRLSSPDILVSGMEDRIHVRRCCYDESVRDVHSSASALKAQISD